MDLEELAQRIAQRAHSSQFRRDGVTPYITHPERMVQYLKSNNAKSEVIAIAWLHDVLEDTSETPESLINNGIPHGIVADIVILTKSDEVAYKEFISLILTSARAREVKIADILDNLGDTPTDEQITKYGKALAVLQKSSD